MNRAQIIAACVLIVAGTLGGSLARAEQQPTRHSALQSIQADYDKGVISLDQKALLQVQAIRHPDQLPVEYRRDPVEARRLNGRSATPTLLRILRDWDQYRPETRLALAAALDRPGGTYTYDSPSGFFKLHYYTTGTDAVPTADDNSNGVPDYIERLASYCDSSLAKHRSIGYYDPPSDNTAGGDSKYDVYFLNLQNYGYTQAEEPGPAPWLDYTSYMVLNNNFLGFPPNDDPEGNQAGAAKATVAHEFHHAIQFGYDVSEVLWYMELDATCMEDIVFDAVNDNYNYLPTFLGDPEETLMQDQGAHPYGSFIYGLYLAQRFDTSLAVAAWEGARYDAIFQVIADTLEGRYGVDRDSSFAEFTFWNFITGDRDDGLHHAEGSEYPTLVVAADYQSYPVFESPCPKMPAGYGASYIRFRPGSSIGALNITFDGSDTRSWAAYIIKSPTLNSHEFERIDLNPSTFDGSIEVLGFENYYSVTLVAVNLTEGLPAAQFYYSADVYTPYSLTSVVHTDSAVCVAETRLFDYEIFNTSETGEVFTVTSSDNMGWITPDTVDVYIGSGESSTIQVQVHPPAGTPLGVTSALEFKAAVKVSPGIFDLQTVHAVTIAHRGDANQDGVMNLMDITLIIGSVYLGGPPLDPMWAADFNCDEVVNLQDITGIISRVYLGGTHSLCDPY